MSILFGNKEVKLSTNGNVCYNFDGQWRIAEKGTYFEAMLKDLYDHRSSPDVRFHYKGVEKKMIEEGLITVNNDLDNTLQSLIDFFYEFDFVPNYRFVNNIVNKAHYDGIIVAQEYIVNYFKLCDSPNKESIADKCNSLEMRRLLKNLSLVVPDYVINNRLKIYFGPQGTGKTTQALKESVNCMVCHSAMLPSDLMEDFKFVDGKPTFEPSQLWLAMECGDSIVLDEINLLPFESLRFLQSLLDNKKQFVYKGKTIHVNEGFKIIGTMNLYVNSIPYPLPEPLVDRCADIIESNITPEILMSAIKLQ